MLPDLITSGWFITNVLPYWLIFIAGCLLVRRLSK
jgi:hypothetical protein